MIAVQPVTQPPRSLLRTLLDEPARFGFDAAVAVLMRAAGRSRPGDAIRFHAAPGLGFVTADLTAVEPAASGFRVTTGLLGLTGASGVLPRPYTDLVNGEQRRRSPALGDFLDLLAQRPVAHFASAGIKYQPHRAAQAAANGDEAPRGAADGLRQALLAVTGYATPHLAPRLTAGTEPLLFYAGLFAGGPRSADRLAAIVADWLEQTVRVEQFDGGWLSLGTGEMSALPRPRGPGVSGAGQFNQLGVDATIGGRSWDVQSRIRLRIGPLPLDRFNALLPGGPLFRRLASLVRAFLDGGTDFTVNPVLAASEVPPLALRPAASLRLGWNSWLPTGTPRRHDGTEAVFETAGALEAGAA